MWSFVKSQFLIADNLLQNTFQRVKFLDFSERSHWPGVIPGLGNAAPELGVTISRDVTLVTFVT